MGAAGFIGGYGPDLDHRNSTASRLLGPVTGLASWLVRGASRMAYATTKGRNDEPGNGEHRHLAHSLVAAAAVGFGMWLLLLSWLPTMAALLGASVAAGWVAAICGDACTVSGVSGFLWPVPIRGETFYECFLLPPGLRIRTGRAVERLLVFPVSVLTAVLLLPGIWPVAQAVFAQLGT